MYNVHTVVKLDLELVTFIFNWGGKIKFSLSYVRLSSC